jgi:hypothetical protein
MFKPEQSIPRFISSNTLFTMFTLLCGLSSCLSLNEVVGADLVLSKIPQHTSKTSTILIACEKNWNIFFLNGWFWPQPLFLFHLLQSNVRYLTLDCTKRICVFYSLQENCIKNSVPKLLKAGTTFFHAILQTYHLSSLCRCEISTVQQVGFKSVLWIIWSSTEVFIWNLCYY